ncbi:MAG: hypothetical protein FWE57_04260 [Chitinispirillia bacterium]|nr:hypothetical protein [Chitinispirillia bacterium]
METWIALSDISRELGITTQDFQNKYGDNVCCVQEPAGPEVLFSSLPVNIQKRCRALINRETLPIEIIDICKINTGNAQVPPAQEETLPAIAINSTKAEIDIVFLDLYNKAPYYNKEMFDYYHPIIMDYQECKESVSLQVFVEQYNQAHPNKPLSVKTFYKKLKLFREGGKAALLGNYGKNRGRTTVPDSMYENYKACVMMNDGVSKVKAWQVATGLEVEAGSNFEQLPKVQALDRLHKRKVPKAVETLARKGVAVYNRECAPYIERDDSVVLAGEYWMADHYQEDKFVIVKGYKKPQRPWVTVWADVKSRRILSAYAYIGNPNSDDIFTAFHAAASKHGTPRHMLVDNGKDFRAHDLTGGRKGGRRISLAQGLNIKVHFAIPYNPQTKHIERQFRTLHATTSVWFKGFCGGSVDKRPEQLDANIKAGNIETFEEYVERLQYYIDNVQSKMPFSSGRHKGKSPAQIWREEYPLARKKCNIPEVSPKQLDLLCYRTSKDLTIVRGGIRYSEVRTTYRSDDLWQHDRKKVYLSFNHTNMEIAHVYDASTHELLCEVTAIFDIPMLIEDGDEVGQNMLSEASASKGRIIKSVRTAAKPGVIMTPETALRALGVFASKASNDDGTELPNVHNTDGAIMLTSKAGVLAKIEEQKQEGLQDLSMLGLDKIEKPKSKKSYGLAADLEDEEDDYFGMDAMINAG